MLRAAREDQRQLLELQNLDSRLARLGHERRTLPVLNEIRSLENQLADTEDERIRQATRLGDLRRDLTRVEDDVEQIRQRTARYAARVEGAGVSAKDAAAIQHEIALLAERTSNLEDAELEQMERVEEAEQQVATLVATATAIAEQVARLSADRDAECDRIEAQAAEVRERRDALAARLPAGLVALYDDVRATTGGLGAVALHGNRLEGASFELSLTELAEIKAAPEDTVIVSEDHDVILVRMD